jgi:hypothetical protein
MNTSYDCQVLCKNFIMGLENKFKTYKLLNRNIHCFPPGVLFTVCRESLILISICPEDTFEKSKECVEKICKIIGVETPSMETMDSLYCLSCDRGYRQYDACRSEWFGTSTTQKIQFVFQPKIITRP